MSLEDIDDEFMPLADYRRQQKERRWNMNKLLQKLKEPGTIRGLILLIGIFGVNLAPEQQNAIIAGVAAVIGLINVFKRG